MPYVPLSGDDAVWSKGNFAPGLDPALWRADEYGALMYRPHYGNRDSEFGWEDDHVYPAALGGLSALFNRRPLFWRNNTERNSYTPRFWRYNIYSRTNMQF